MLPQAAEQNHWKKIFTRIRGGKDQNSDNRVFPKIYHSVRIVFVEYTIGSVVELNFC